MAVHGSVNSESLDCVPSFALVKLPAMNTTCHGLNAPATENMKTVASSEPKAMVSSRYTQRESALTARGRRPLRSG